MIKELLQIGSQGDATKGVQELLNRIGGYGLAEDGIYGPKTKAAVEDFQGKNNLDVDGIVGKNTGAALISAAGLGKFAAAEPLRLGTSVSNGAESDAGFQESDATKAAKKAVDDHTANKPGEYVESDIVAAAKKALEDHMASQPGEYQSQWQAQLDEAINKILNREKFSYDFNGDALYQQYKDKYIQQGKMAMADTMGQAAAMTGGYGNSYAATVGNQAYQQSLQQLNDVIPELYQMAYDRYNQEGQDLYNQYAMISDRENADYGRYRDSVTDWKTALEYLTGRYDTEWNKDYGMHQDKVDNWQTELDYLTGRYDTEWNKDYGQHRDGVEDAQWQATMDYNEGRDAVEDEHWEKEYDLAAAKVAGTGGDTPGGNDNTGGNGGISEDDIKKMQAAVGVDQDGKWGPKSTEAAGGLSLEEAYEAWKNGTLKKAEPVVKTWDDYSDEELQKNNEEYGGSYYTTVLNDLKQMKAKGKSSAEVNKYLSELVGNSLISRSDYLSLYNKYRDDKLG